jgi:hypothetical protein
VKEKIFMIDDDGLHPMVEEEYEQEVKFQNMIEDHPELLAGELINPEEPRLWIQLKREIRINDAEESADRWALDHLFIDQDSIPTLIEVKRSSDTRIRRRVVGQMMDYAANAVEYWPIDRMREEFGAECVERGEDPSIVISQKLGIEPDQIETFWELAQANLRSRNIRLLFVADKIPKELRRIVEFLNETMTPTEVLAVELKQFVGKGFRTIVPRVLGQTTAAEDSKKRSRRAANWSRTRIDEYLKIAEESHEIDVLKRLWQFAKQNHDDLSHGAGIRPGFGLRYRFESRAYTAWSVRSSGEDTPLRIEFPFGAVQRSLPEYPRLQTELIETLSASNGVLHSIEIGGGWPTFSLLDLTESDLEQIELAALQFQDILKNLNAGHN